ncbi:MAG: BCCT family transporter, partial [Pseudomonadota bacterium]
MHWAIHPWAIYAVSALAVGFFAYRHAAPLSPSAPLHGLRESKDRLAFRVIDWIALVAVLFGVVASIGQGVFQMAAGAHEIAGLAEPDSIGLQLGILVILDAVYLASAAGGLARGIKPLSDLNMALCIALMAFVFIAGPTDAILAVLGDTALAYAKNFATFSFDLGALRENEAWARDWTLTYLLWWIAWGPFVGVFVARISRGRTLRTFVLGVVLAPSLFSIVWFSIFGGAALDAQLAQGIDLGVASFETAPMASYVMLDQLPWAAATKVAAFALIFIFLVTSADSGAYVLGMFSSGGQARPGVAERLFWGLVLAGLATGAVLSGDGPGDSHRAGDPLALPRKNGAGRQA